MIRIVRVTDPVDPTRDQIVTEVECTGLTLPAYIDPSEKAIVSLNGIVWPRELWKDVTPREDDCIVLKPVVQGGALMRGLLSIAVIAAASVITFGVGTPFFVWGGLAAMGSTFGTLLASSIALAGNLLISGLMSPGQPSNKNASASYDPDGPRSLAQSGTVIPKGYGKFLWGGNIISSFTEIAGSDQWINVLVCFGFGPARSITGIQINGKDISTYQNTSYFIRLGTNDQTEIGQFNQIENGYPQQTQCLAGVPVIVPGTGDLTQALYVDIQFPDGVFVNTNDGHIIPAFVTYLVEYAVSGTSDWQPVLQPQTTAAVVQFHPDGSPYFPNAWGVVATDLPANSGVVYTVDNGPHAPGDPWTGSLSVETFQPNGNHSTSTKTCQGEWQLLDINMNYVYVLTWSAGYQDFAAAQTTTCYNRTQILGLAPNKYDVRITKWGSGRVHDDALFGDNWSPTIGQDMWVHEVTEITLLDLAYPNMILLGVRALATSQLSGSSLNVTAIVEHGLRSLDEGLLPAELLGYEEDNPALVAADMMLDTLYGGGAWPGITAANIARYIDEWVSWAESNDTLVPDGNGNSIRQSVFNGIFDNESDLWTQLGVVTAMSRACIVPMGTDYGVSVDQLVDAPVQMFTVGSISQDSFTETFMAIDDRANQVEVQFADSTRYYREDNPLSYMDPAQQDAGVIVKNVRIRGKGITLPAQAWHFARYKQRSNEYLLRTGSFKTDTEGIACRPFSVIALQHDVPQWGWGGRTLPGSTATRLLLDRNDAPFVAGTTYSVMVLHPAVQRFSGTVGSVAASTTPPGTTLTLAGWTNTSRITRAIVAGVDCVVMQSAAGAVVVQPPPGVTLAASEACVLWDSDVLETVPVTGMDPVTRGLILGTPLSQAPADYSNYIYGVSGAVKWVRATVIKKADNQRSTIEWIEYQTQPYDIGTPVIGETSAIVVSKPGVLSLTGSEILQLVSGSYVPYASLSWKSGPSTAGAAIFAQYSGVAGLPTLIGRVTGVSTFQVQQSPGVTVTYTVVGFDQSNNFAPFTTAPSVTIAAVGVTTNLLLGSSFASGFTYWNIKTPAGTTLVPQFADDGQALLTVGGSTVSTAQLLLSQVVMPSKWLVGQLLMLSGYVEDTATTPLTAPNVGNVQLSIVFQDSAGTVISSTTVDAPLSGVQPTLTRFNTAVVAVPTGTAQVVVTVSLAGSSLSLPAGSTIAVNHLLLETASSSGQTTPSTWADIDANGQVLDLFTTGSSTGLRVQGSTVPTFTGAITCTPSNLSLVVSWASLVILWPDGAFTHIEDGSITITGLTISTTYVIYLYFDIINGGVRVAVPTTPLGTPAYLSAAVDAVAEAACKQDGRVPLTPGGFSVTTTAAGTGSPVTGGGGGTGPSFPITCTVRGTELVTPTGPVSNETLMHSFQTGHAVYLQGREGPERFLMAAWAPVSHYYEIAVEGFPSFGASESLTLKPVDGPHRWCSKIPDGTIVETSAGPRVMHKTRVDKPNEVLFIHLDGPGHEYMAAGGVWTHNFDKINPGTP